MHSLARLRRALLSMRTMPSVLVQEQVTFFDTIPLLRSADVNTASRHDEYTARE